MKVFDRPETVRLEKLLLHVHFQMVRKRGASSAVTLLVEL